MVELPGIEPGSGERRAVGDYRLVRELRGQVLVVMSRYGLGGATTLAVVRDTDPHQGRERARGG
jgi:hypothetical protein